MSATPETGLRFNAGKPVLSMVLEAKHALAGAARVLEFGRKKYTRGNWRKGLPLTEVADSLLRHTAEWLAGEDYDEESGELHVDHMHVNTLFLAELTRTHPELDSRSDKEVLISQETIAKVFDAIAPTYFVSPATLRGSDIIGPGLVDLPPVMESARLDLTGMYGDPTGFNPDAPKKRWEVVDTQC